MFVPQGGRKLVIAWCQSDKNRKKIVEEGKGQVQKAACAAVREAGLWKAGLTAPDRGEGWVEREGRARYAARAHGHPLWSCQGTQRNG